MLDWIEFMENSQETVETISQYIHNNIGFVSHGGHSVLMDKGEWRFFVFDDGDKKKVSVFGPYSEEDKKLSAPEMIYEVWKTGLLNAYDLELIFNRLWEEEELNSRDD